MKLGFLFRGDTFKLLSDGAIYQAGSTDAEGYVNCTNIKTNEEKKIYVDEDVESSGETTVRVFKEYREETKNEVYSSIQYRKGTI